ncbi:MAG: helix-turn-helix domain-containing protein [Methanomassiliicoccales archaeon]|nr:helix-turn-helix domain-containing protein [Methanomassiliicoccales archaeon]
MDELDRMLSVIENPTRRRILEALVREPHYPLQLARELGLSQQGIMKHLRMLEELDLVGSFSEESERGPSRRRYFPTTGFTIVVDIGPGLFNTDIVTRPIEERLLERPVGEGGRRLLDLRQEVEAIDRELDGLKGRRAQLIAQKEALLEEAGQVVEVTYPDYRSRKIVYEYVLHPEMDKKELAEALGLRDDLVEGILGTLEVGDDDIGGQ